MISSEEFLNAYKSKQFEAYSACVRLLAHKEIAGKKLRKPVCVSFHRDRKAPALAWLCVSTATETKFVLGPRVEKVGRTFFEGVWDGPVDKAGFRQSDNFFGTGCSFRKYLVFTPPRHCFDGIYAATSQGVTYVTNSMALLIKTTLPGITDDRLRNLAERMKAHCNEATAQGADLSNPFATIEDDWSFYRVMYHNFGLCEDGIPVRVFHHEQELEKTFEGYRGTLERVTKALTNNAQSEHRKFPLSVVSTISNGYDSTACTAIAMTAGCTIAHTIAGDVRGRSDSGEEIGAQLGIEVKKHAHILETSDTSLALHINKKSMKYAAEFLATAGLGDDVVFASFEADIKNCIVFEGSFGDGIWAKRRRTLAGLPTGLPTAKSKNEFHLRNATNFIPLPVIGAKFAEGIRTVLRQPSMEPFFLGTRYDRPLPRRIVEEAGGNRESFGQRKGATAPTPKNFAPLLAPAFRIVMTRYDSIAATVIESAL